MLNLNRLVEAGDAEGILEYAREFHGHVCPYLALGIRASLLAMEELDVGRLDYSGSVDESILAIVEVNSCFTDGVQVTTGCTLGNNSLIYFDLGKTALTLVKRSTWEGVRVYADAERLAKYYPPGARELFNKVIKERRGTPEERAKLWKLWEEAAHRMLHLPREEFKVERVKVPPIEQAPIFDSVRCSKCGELVMETRAVYLDGKPFCLRCAGKKYLGVVGRGIIELGGRE
ncbi:FmdE family protein [Thermococcus gorgonarius]|uniref:Formylmethanofuran dehydrogenase n=1 Tax=Thermococcus gorgonarius TaxID=71997 RepID=A0A2Z2M7Z9_THEGO|nr:FmdE family protein [Thermococcus gorgonarius]ASJ01453.1 formylmethanofuran dehydrogenase [Thermococcus gorgonarius]